MIIGNELKEVRRELGLTQKGLAEELGVSLPTVVNWELGKSTPRGKNRLKLEAFIDKLNEEDDLLNQEMLDALQVVADELGFESIKDLFKTIIRKHNIGFLDL